MCAINISVAISQFLNCYLSSGIKKKSGVLLSGQPLYIDLLMIFGITP
jgi:hypothetical protein